MLGVIFILALLIPLVAVILDSQLGRALAARLERDRVGGAVADRLAALEGEVDRLTREMRRLEEETEFLHRLLERKPGPGGALPSRESSD
ncbi:MAG TPA: hypothetical protein VF212_16790 [Longimicrobiales bacterium]